MTDSATTCLWMPRKISSLLMPTLSQLSTQRMTTHLLWGLLSTDVSTGQTNGQGIAHIPVFANCVYDILVNGDGFENNWAAVKVHCTESDITCATRVQLTMSPDLDAGEATLTPNWGSQVDNMGMKLYYVSAYSSDEYLMADVNNPDTISNAQYIMNTMEYSEIDGLSNANSILLSGLSEQNAVTYMVTAYNADTANMDKAESMVTFADGNSTRKIGINWKFEFEQSLRGILLLGGWSTISDIFNTEAEEHRNSLIVELASWSANSVY